MYNSSVAVTPEQSNAYDNKADENKKKGSSCKNDLHEHPSTLERQMVQLFLQYPLLEHNMFGREMKE
jgi:hypothetical protein